MIKLSGRATVAKLELCLITKRASDVITQANRQGGRFHAFSSACAWSYKRKFGVNFLPISLGNRLRDVWLSPSSNNLHSILIVTDASSLERITVFHVKTWTPAKISGIVIVSRPVRREIKPQKITDKPQNGLITTWHETTSSLFLPRGIFNFTVFKYWNFSFSISALL